MRNDTMLEPTQFDECLNPEVQEPEVIGAKLKPCSSEMMECEEGFDAGE
jgi:hypothetical protein